MRILIKECKKILDLRILLLLGVFTFLYYFMFMQIRMHPNGGQETMSPYDIPFAAELVEDIGPVLAVNDWSVIEEKIDQLKGEYNKIIASDKVFQRAGITTKDELDKWMERLDEKEEEDYSEEERAVLDRREDLIFEDPVSSPLSFQIQYAEGMNNFEGSHYGVPEEEADAIVEELYSEPGTTELYKAAMRERCTKKEVSLLPSGMFYIVQEDMRYMAVLLVICFLALMVPYQIRERLRGVMPLYASTHIGRKIFGRQLTAGLISCGMVGLIQLLVYLGIYAAKGLLVFWSCPAWSARSNDYWLDGLSFGQYMLLYMLLVWIFAVAGVAAVWCIGRKAPNYIAGISICVPVGGILCWAALILFDRMFRIFSTDRIPLWQPMVLAVWMLFVGMVLMVWLRRDKKTDLLM